MTLWFIAVDLGRFFTPNKHETFLMATYVTMYQAKFRKKQLKNYSVFRRVRKKSNQPPNLNNN